MNKTLSPLKSIRLKCLDCSGYSTSEVRLCTITNCPLYKYRFGKNPQRKLSEAEKTKHMEYLKKAREKKYSMSSLAKK